jgi:hypothetical protein
VRGGHQHPEPSGGVATAWPPLPPPPPHTPCPFTRPLAPSPPAAPWRSQHVAGTVLDCTWRAPCTPLSCLGLGLAPRKTCWGFSNCVGSWQQPRARPPPPRPAPPPRPHPHHHLSLCRTGLHIMEDTCRQPVKMDPTVGAGACAWRAVSHPICVPCSSVANNCPPLPRAPPPPPLVPSPTLQARVQLESHCLWSRSVPSRCGVVWAGGPGTSCVVAFVPFRLGAGVEWKATGGPLRPQNGPLPRATTPTVWRSSPRARGTRRRRRPHPPGLALVDSSL